MQTTPATDVLIPLRGGFTAKTSTILWLIEVSARLNFAALPDDTLIVTPKAAITAADDKFIKAHKTELLAAARYIDQQETRPL